MNDIVETLAATSGRPATARHISLTAMRVGALVMRPLKPDLAGLIRAAILMDTDDMSLDLGELLAGYPDIQLTHLADVVRSKYANA